MVSELPAVQHSAFSPSLPANRQRHRFGMPHWLPPAPVVASTTRPPNPTSADLTHMIDFLEVLTEERAHVARHLEAQRAELAGATRPRPGTSRQSPPSNLHDVEAELSYLGHLIADLNDRIEP